MFQKNEKKKMRYVDGLKGISCVLILLGHFSSIYKMAESAPKLEGIVTSVMTRSPLAVFFNENYWLYLKNYNHCHKFRYCFWIKLRSGTGERKKRDFIEFNSCHNSETAI